MKIQTVIIIIFFYFLTSIQSKAEEVKAKPILNLTNFDQTHDEDTGQIIKLTMERKVAKSKGFAIAIFIEESFAGLKNEFDSLKQGWHWRNSTYLNTHLNYKGIKIYKNFLDDDGQISFVIGTDADIMLRMEIKF